MSSAWEQATAAELDGDIEQAVPERDERERDEPESDERRFPALVLGVCALTLFFVTQILQVFPALELGRLQLVKITTVGVALLFLASRQAITSRVRIAAAPQLKCLIALLAFAALTVPFAVWSEQSFRYIVEVYAKNVIFVYLLVQGVRSDSASRMVGGALILGCSTIVLAMLTGFGPLVEERGGTVRLSVGNTYDSNDLALLIVITLPFAFFMLKASRPVARALLILSIALMLVGLVKTGSRGGFLGLIIIMLFMLLRGSRQARKYALVAIAASVILFAAAAPSAYWERIKTIYNYENDYNMKEKGGRLMIWQTGLQMIAQRPITGVGIACFSIAHVRLAGQKLEMAPHNSFIQVAAELGIVGLFLFTAIIFISLRAARRIRRRAREGLADTNLLWLASAVEISFIGFIVSGSLLSHAYSAIFCFLAGMAAALIAQHNATQEQASSDEEEIVYA